MADSENNRENGSWRFLPWHRWLVELTILMAVFAFVIAYQAKRDRDQERDGFERDVAAAEGLRYGCERINTGLRDPLFDALGLGAKVANRSSYDVAAAGFREQRENMIEAAGGAKRFPDQPVIDCAQAFPLPGLP